MATQQTAMRITATTAQDRSTGLAACHLLLAVLIKIVFFATQALKRKPSYGKFRRATAIFNSELPPSCSVRFSWGCYPLWVRYFLTKPVSKAP